MENVSIKANIKTGGINHAVVEGHAGEVLKKRLVLKADITHPGTAAIFGTPSIAAVVGSVEDTGGKFLGSWKAQSEANKEANLSRCKNY